MKKIKIATTMMIILFLFFVVYNTVFGWNILPINEYEEVCDNIFRIGAFFSWIIYFAPLLDVYEKFIKKSEEK